LDLKGLIIKTHEREGGGIITAGGIIFPVDFAVIYNTVSTQ
jgi:hypothetical protein